jgi:DNA invertase Pin-like site-specific DNA recombinase
MKAAIYIRVSTASKTKHGAEASYDQNPDVQEQPLRELARQRGWEVHQVIPIEQVELRKDGPA